MAEKKSWIPDLGFSRDRDKKARERIRKEQDTESIDDLILQGRLTRAQQVLELRIAENDQDVHSHLKLAELLAGKRKNEEALRSYLRAAQLLSEDGFFDKSLALLKTARKLPGQRRQQHRRHGGDGPARQGARHGGVDHAQGQERAKARACRLRSSSRRCGAA